MSTTVTEALVLAHQGAPFVRTQVTLCAPAENEVLVRIVASGLCHTDLALQAGEFPTAFPSIAGHEGAGIVEAVGKNVTRVQKGDSVLLSFSYCEACECCLEGHPAGCEELVPNNFGRRRNKDIGDRGVATGPNGEEIKGTFFGQSSFGRHAVVVEMSCVKVPKGTDLTMLAPLGCGLQTGAGAVLNTLKPAPSASIAIFGFGAVGAAALFASSYLKLANIIVVDVVPSRLELAKELGAHHAINGRDADVVQQIRNANGGRGVKYAVEATGRVACLESAWKALANFGHVASVGDPGPGHQPPFHIHDAVTGSKSYSGVAEGDSNPPVFIPFLMKLYEEGKFPIDRLAKTYKFEDFDEAVEAMKSGTVIKPIIVFD